jgi:cell wall-associated NlpC family hydrolase
MQKRFISISVIALVMTSSTAAFAQLTDASVGSKESPTVRQVTVAPELITASPVRVKSVLSGPVKVSPLSTGPIFSTEEAEIGSVEWLAQEKARQDKIESDAERKQAELEAEIARLEKIARDTKNLNKAIAATKKYVGKTWYVLTGSTPDGWDCSGLVMWTYGNVGVNLYHGATAQKNSGEFVTEPKLGDIVAFTRKGSNSAFHTGIYIGPDEMLHAGGRKGDRTEIVSIRRWAKGNGNVEVTYTRLIETNN